MTTTNRYEIYFIVIDENGFEHKFFEKAQAKEHIASFGGTLRKVIVKVTVLEEIGDGVWG